MSSRKKPGPIFVNRKLLEQELTMQLNMDPSKKKAIVDKLIEMALSGNLEAMKMLFERDSGKVRELVDHRITQSPVLQQLSNEQVLDALEAHLTIDMEEPE